MILHAVGIGDYHEPFANEKAKARMFTDFRKLAEKGFSPKYIIQVGDGADRYSNNRFGKSWWIDPEEEDQLAYEKQMENWKILKGIWPRAKRYQKIGNHEARLTKTAIKENPELLHILKKELIKLCSFPGVTTIHDADDELILDDVQYIHGYMNKLGAHMMKTHRNTVCGHTHRGGVFLHPWENEIKWELNCGFLGDRNHAALRYTAWKRFTEWTMGYGLIWKINGVLAPQFVPIEEKSL